MPTEMRGCSRGAARPGWLQPDDVVPAGEHEDGSVCRVSEPVRDGDRGKESRGVLAGEDPGGGKGSDGSSPVTIGGVTRRRSKSLSKNVVGAIAVATALALRELGGRPGVLPP